jgi:FlaA1/EpsC-like NDP-sugar epimerase
MMNKKALIIGATGATGTSLVKQLLENEHYSLFMFLPEEKLLLSIQN